MDNNHKEILEQIIRELLSRMDLDSRFEIDESQPDFVVVKIETEEAGLLIGQAGVNLESFQHLARALVSKKLGAQSPRFFVDINNYVSGRLELLKEMALSVAEKVKSEKQIKILEPMPAYERRVVHLVLSNVEGIQTESQGEEPNRRIVIKPSSNAS